MSVELSPSDLTIMIHANGAALSKSTNKKLYLIFAQCPDVPLRIRRTTWFLQSVWCGAYLPKDREPFLLELTRQMKALQPSGEAFKPVKWTNAMGKEMESAVYIHSALADAPERAALSGQLSHSSKQGCHYCEQVCKKLRHFAPKLKTC